MSPSTPSWPESKPRPTNSGQAVFSEVSTMAQAYQQPWHSDEHLGPALWALPNLLQSPQVQQMILLHLPLSVWLINSEGLFLYCNAAFAALVGASPAEIRGQPVRDFISSPQADRLLVQDPTPHALEPCVKSEEWLEFKRTGYRGLFEVFRIPLRNSDGHLLGMLGIGHEITQQRASENLRQRQQQHYALLNAVHQAMIRFREPEALLMEICEIMVKQGKYRMAWIGLKPQQGEVIVPLYHAGYSKGYVEALKLRLYQNHGPTSQTLRKGQYRICQDIATDPQMAPWREAALDRGYRASASFPIYVQGEVIATVNLYAAQPHFFDEEEVAFLLQLTENISMALENHARHQAQHHQLLSQLHQRSAELRQSKQRFQYLIENLQPDYFLFSLDGNLCVTYLSPGASDLLGKPLEALLHQPWYEVLPVVPATDKQQLHQQALAGHIPPRQELEIEVQGQSHVLEIVQYAVYDTQGKLLRCEGLVKDITHNKQMEAALRQACERAERASQAKSQFISHMSHELRTPLNAILGFSELLQEQIQEPRWQGYLQTITRSGHALLQIINDILDLSKIEAGKLTLHLEAVPLRLMIQELVSLLQLSFEKKNLQFLVQISEDLPTALWLDPLRVRQVLLNLLNNALKYTAQGQVCLRVTWSPLTSETGQLRLSVADTGPGISPEFQAHLFEPFAQDPASGSISTGTGLGLPISRNLVHLMGGELLLETQQGQGSTFTVFLPEVKIATAPTAPVQPSRSLRLAPATLLLADDVAHNLELLEAYLADQPLTCLRAYNGQEAYEQALRSHPDLILMDIKMPVMDGREALHALRANPQTAAIPVVALTAFSFEQEEHNLRLQGFDAYLRKPVSKSSLLQCLEQFLPTAPEQNPLAPQAVPTSLPQPFEVSPASVQALQQILQTDWLPRWQKVRHSLVLDELESFIGELQALAVEYQHAGLLDWTQALLEALQRFDLETVHQRLQSFPEDCGLPLLPAQEGAA